MVFLSMLAFFTYTFFPHITICCWFESGTIASYRVSTIFPLKRYVIPITITTIFVQKIASSTILIGSNQPEVFTFHNCSSTRTPFTIRIHINTCSFIIFTR